MARLTEIADEVSRTHERVRVTRKGSGDVVLIAIEDLESMEATLELLSDAEAVVRVQRAEDEVASADVTTAAAMARALESRGRDGR